MSQESMTWLNSMCLIGFTDKRGNAWHYRADEQGDEPNHYVGAIPIEDVERRLFYWEAVEGDFQTTGHIITPDGVTEFTLTDPTRKTMLRPPGTFGPDDPGHVFSAFRSGYTGHQYKEWLLNQVALILDDELSIGSAGLLKQGAQAFVQVEVPETFTTPEGVAFRPFVGACTSFDGSLASTYKRGVTVWKCDNTMAAGLGEKGGTYKVKHSRYSHAKLANAREALELVHTIADEFSAEVAQLTNTTVSEGDWAKFLDEISPLKNDKGEDKEGRAYTLAITKRAEMTHLWETDDRVAPWRGTAFGVVQAVNTHAHHLQKINKGERAVRNMERAYAGEFDKIDNATVAKLEEILAIS